MKFRRHATGLALGLCFGVLSGTAVAGLEEGAAAYGKGDYATAMREFRPLAVQSNALAQFRLGVMYANGQGVAKDFKEAEKWYQLAAAQGHADAQFELGGMYSDGGMARTQEGLKWYTLAAMQGHILAQAKLGFMYHLGLGLYLGVAPDYQEAVKWYRLAAGQGDGWSQLNLGLMYNDGLGVAQDYREAAKWHRLAAAQGIPRAQFNLGAMYQYGRGVPSSPVAAYALYSLAAEHDDFGSSKARETQTRFGKTLSSKEIEAVQALMRELCKPGNLLNALDQYVKTTVSPSVR